MKIKHPLQIVLNEETVTLGEITNSPGDILTINESGSISRRTTSEILADTSADTRYMVVVSHGSTASTARPAGATAVYWVGSVAPENAELNDIWIDTANQGHLEDFSDVTITDISTGEILVWDGDEWVNNTLSEAGIASASHNHDDVYYTKTEVDTLLSGKASSSHSHDISDVTGLQTALDGKASSSHTHLISDVTNLQSNLDDKANDDEVVKLTGNQTIEGNKIFSSPFGNNTTFNRYAGNQFRLDVAALEGLVDTWMFRTVDDIEYWDGGAWVAWATTGWKDTVRGQTAGNPWAIPVENNHFRFTIDSPQHSSGILHIRFGDYSGLIPGRTITAESSADKVSWTTDAVYEAGQQQHFVYINFTGNNSTRRYRRITIQATTPHNGEMRMRIARLAFFSARDLPSESNQVFTWDNNKNLTVLGQLMVDVVNNGTGDFATINSSGLLRKRSSSEVLSDIGAAASSHSHIISDITGLQTALDGKASSTHSHDISDVTGLQTALDGKASTSHSHAAADVTSGTFDIARIPTGTTSTTVSLGNHNHTLDSLSNVTITSNSNGEILKWNGSAWVNNTLAEAGIAAASHNHDNVYYTETEIDALLEGYAELEHTHAASDITSGTFDIARLPTGTTSSTVSLGNHNHTLDSLSNVTITSNSSNEILQWNGSAWINRTLSEAGIAASSHTHSASDITSGTLNIARIPTGSTSSTVSLGNHSHTLDSLSNVTITSNTAGEILQWNGSAWINRTLEEAGITGGGEHDHDDRYYTKTESEALFIQVVEHGSTANTERPADATVVYWYGSVEPENKAPGDIWFDSDADPLDFAYQNQNNTFSGDNLFSGDNDFVGGFTLVDFLDISDSILMYGRTSIIGYNTAETDDYTLMRVNSSDELLIGNTDGFPLVLRSTVDPTVVVSSNDPETVLHTGNHEEVIVVCLSDETSDLETGDDVVRFRMPFAMEITEVRASVSDAPTGSVITIDIKEDNSTIFSTKLTIDASEKTSTTAATPYVLSDTTLADDAEISFDIDTVGSTNPGKGLKVTLKGYQI